MKIAIYHNLPKGGAKRFLFECVKRLSKQHQIYLYTLSCSSEKQFLPLKKYIKSESIYDFDLGKNFLMFLKAVYIDLPLISKKIALDIDKDNFDLVLLTHDFLTKCPFLASYLKTYSAYICHEPPREFYEPLSLHASNIKEKIATILRYPLKAIDYKNVQRINVLITTSGYSQKILKHIYHRNFFNVRGGVDSEIFKYKKYKREKFLLSTGALNRLKGFDFLIKSLARVPKSLMMPLVLVGYEGRDEKYFKKLASLNNVKLIIKKFISDKELIELYNKAYLFLFASHQEPLGLVCLEAMSCGLPVLGVREGGITETVGKYGLLVNRDKDEFAKVLGNLLTNQTQVNNLRVKTNVYMRDEWSWETVAADLSKILMKKIK